MATDKAIGRAIERAIGRITESAIGQAIGRAAVLTLFDFTRPGKHCLTFV